MQYVYAHLLPFVRTALIMQWVQRGVRGISSLRLLYDPPIMELLGYEAPSGYLVNCIWILVFK